MKEDEIGFSMAIEDDLISFERKTVREKRKLTYQTKKCVGCGLCFEACPVEAIELGPTGTLSRGLVDSPTILIDPEKCTLCGICAAVCVLNVIDLLIDDSSIKGLDGYLRYKKEFKFDEKKCKMKDEAKEILCRDCEEACPREAIEAKIVKIKGKPQNTIVHDAELCICCSTCVKACPEDAIEVEKIFDGEIEVDLDLCQGCGVCAEVCPSHSITLPKPELGERVDKIVVDEETCISCGACENACPVEGIKVKRGEIRYVKEKERSWTKTWEENFNKLISKEE
jgi:4Fe-4S ferredoxin